MQILKLLIVCIALTSCASIEQRAEEQKEVVAKMLAVYGPACSSLGYAVNTDPWRNCILQLDDINREETYRRLGRR